MPQPFGPVTFVYDVSHTEPMGDTSLPDRFANAFAMPPMANVEQALPRLIENIKADGVRVSRTSAGAGRAGHIRQVVEGRSHDAVVDRRLMKRTSSVPIRYELVVNGGHTATEQLATVAHELGHLYCGRLGTPDPSWWPDRWKATRNVRELEGWSKPRKPGRP